MMTLRRPWVLYDERRDMYFTGRMSVADGVPAFTAQIARAASYNDRQAAEAVAREWGLDERGVEAIDVL